MNYHATGRLSGPLYWPQGCHLRCLYSLALPAPRPCTHKRFCDCLTPHTISRVSRVRLGLTVMQAPRWWTASCCASPRPSRTSARDPTSTAPTRPPPYPTSSWQVNSAYLVANLVREAATRQVLGLPAYPLALHQSLTTAICTRPRRPGDWVKGVPHGANGLSQVGGFGQ